MPAHLFAYCLLLFKNETSLTILPIHMLICGRAFCSLAYLRTIRVLTDNLAIFSCGLYTAITFDNPTITLTACKCAPDVSNLAIFIVLSCHLHCLVAW